jgi:hypothetical protein
MSAMLRMNLLTTSSSKFHLGKINSLGYKTIFISRFSLFVSSLIEEVQNGSVKNWDLTASRW